jgi:nitrogen regulatory protein P-II 1
VKLEIVITDGIVERRVDTIQKYSHTCNTGDRKIFVSDVENTVYMKTNARAEDARG